MGQIGEQEFRDAITGTKKDAKLVAAAKNDRINSPEALYKEFEKLSVDRQREIIGAISSDYFVGGQWKVSFQLNNSPAPLLPDVVKVAGKALFYTRDEASVIESIRAIRLYQSSPFLKQISSILQEASETAGARTADVARILTDPEVFGMWKVLEPVSPFSEKIVASAGRSAIYTKDLASTIRVAKFLSARRYSPHLNEFIPLIENSVYMARDRKSVEEILRGFNAGAIDLVLQRINGDKRSLSVIRDVAWKTRDARAISAHLDSYLQ